MGNFKTNTNSQTMISNKTIAIAAVGFASANALALQAKLRAQVESQDIFSDFADWTVGAANDAVFIAILKYFTSFSIIIFLLSHHYNLKCRDFVNTIGILR